MAFTLGRGLALLLLAVFPLAQTASNNHVGRRQTPSTCPDYSSYSRTPHEPFSNGTLKLPNMRPSLECRTFTSPAVEKVISDMQARLKDPDIAMLFSNTFPSTLDTTVSYFNASENVAFIITGDIPAQWLRDTGNQFAHLYKLLPQDTNLQALVKSVINTESRYIGTNPYCSSFQPPPESGLSPGTNDYQTGVIVNPPIDKQIVWECKYELDSLSGFIKLSRSYYANTKDASFANSAWTHAIDQIMTLIENESQGSWTEDWDFVSYYNWSSTPGSLSSGLTNGGNGEPTAKCGLVKARFRPSDDQCVFGFITSANAMMSVELGYLADMLDDMKIQPNVSALARSYSHTIKKAIWNQTIATNGIFAYETNGFGGQYVMDDANVPSLVSLPYLGFLDRNDTTYQKTKAAMFSRANPYYAAAPDGSFSGIGGPHISATYPWPMSQISAIFGTDSDDEIKDRLSIIVNNTAGLGLIHESIHIYNTSDFSRPWFAWANSYFAEMILDLAERKPSLIFHDSTPYILGQS